MKIVLIGNYAPERQESMLRFSSTLHSEFQARRLDVELWRPEPAAARGLDTLRGLGKWLGYIDKFVLFPTRIAARTRRLGGVPRVFHVCDHSNASYTSRLGRQPHLVTCHDLLAVRSALGEFPENPTRWSGRRLQSMILSGLSRAGRIASVSDATRKDVIRSTRLPPERGDLVYMGFNHPYAPMPAAEARVCLERFLPCEDTAFLRNGGPAWSFLLHVGGGQWYKNRLGLLRIYAALRRLQPRAPALALVGAPLSVEMNAFIRREGLAGSVRRVPAAENELLRALYSAAEGLVFPSLAEGFGWPVAEAQACGCRVAATGRPPMTEVGGEAEVYFEPSQPGPAAARIAALLAESADERAERVRSGLVNSRRFTTLRMIDQYLVIYAKLVSETP